MEAMYTVQISISPKSASVLMKEYKLLPLWNVSVGCILYITWQVTQQKQCNVLGGKMMNTLDLELGSLDKQIPGLGRQGLTPQTDTALPPRWWGACIAHSPPATVLLHVTYGRSLLTVPDSPSYLPLVSSPLCSQCDLCKMQALPSLCGVKPYSSTPLLLGWISKSSTRRIRATWSWPWPIPSASLRPLFLLFPAWQPPRPCSGPFPAQGLGKETVSSSRKFFLPCMSQSTPLPSLLLISACPVTLLPKSYLSLHYLQPSV